MMIAVTGDFVPTGNDRLYGFRKALRNAAAGEERRLDAFRLEDAQNAPDTGVRSVLALGVFLVIHQAIRQRAHILAALEVEGQRHRDPIVVGPEELVSVVFFQHAFLPAVTSKMLVSDRQGNRHRPETFWKP